MEPAKTGSKLAQLQALRGRRLTEGRRQPSLVDVVSGAATIAVMRAVNRIPELEAEIRRLKAEIVMLHGSELRASKARNVTCPKCEAAKKANAGRVKKWRSSKKRKSKS